MKRIVRLTERDLTRIVKRVINESSERKEILVENPVAWVIARVVQAGIVSYRWRKVVGFAQDVTDIANSATDIIPMKPFVNAEKSLSNLFYWGTKNNGSTDVDYKTKIKQLYNAMDGLDVTGSGEDVVEEVMGSLKNMNQLSKLIHKWNEVTGSDESLYDWLIGDLDAEDIWNAIGSWKDKYAIYNRYMNEKGEIIIPKGAD